MAVVTYSNPALRASKFLVGSATAGAVAGLGKLFFNVIFFTHKNQLIWSTLFNYFFIFDLEKLREFFFLESSKTYAESKFEDTLGVSDNTLSVLYDTTGTE